MRTKSNTTILSCSVLAVAAALCLSPLGGVALAQEAAEEDIAEPASPAEEQAQVVQGGIPAWGITDVELPGDPEVVWGRLDNGMRYAIKQHEAPTGEASIRFIVNVGAREESDAEEGAAHYLEHMAFNGSTNIPEGELVPMLERLGLAFGADTNAETSLEYTMYKLDIPNVDDETVDTSLMILREMASELTIAPEAVERERGIILSEYQVRNTPPRRRISQFLRDVLETPRVGDRVTAEPESIAAQTAEKLRAFYEGYYRPDRATLVIVGDVDPNYVEAELTKKFSDWQPKGEARERYSAKPADQSELAVSLIVDPATPELIDLQRVAPYKTADNSFTEFRNRLLEEVAAVALSNRVNALANQENPRTLGGQALAQDLFQSARSYGLLVVAADGKWDQSLALAEQEWRRAAEHGFTFSEIDEAKTNMASNFGIDADQADTIGNVDIATQIAISSLNNQVYTSPQTKNAIYNALADTFTPEAVHQAFRNGWGPAPTYIMLASKTDVPDAKNAIASTLADSAQVAVAKPEEAEEVTFAYSDFGEPGKVVSEDWIEDLEIRTIEFANGVQLNLKYTEFGPNQLTIRTEVGQGSSIAPEGYAGLNLLTTFLAPADGLGAHKVEDLRRVLAGKQVATGYTMQSDTLSLNGDVTREDALLQLQLMAAQISDPAFSAETQRQWDGAAPIVATTIANSPEQVLGVALEAVLTDGDDRMGFLDPAVMVERSVDDMKAVIGNQFAEGLIKIAIVGEFDEATIIKEVAATLGALERPTVNKQEPRPLQFTQDRSLRTLYHTGEPDQGAISISWPTEDAHDMRGSLTRQLLSELIFLRAIEVLREELGATYTPSVESTSSLTFDGYGHLTLRAPADPATMDQVSQTVRGLVAELVANPPSEDSLARARNPKLEGYERQVGRNAGWTGIVVEAQNDSWMLDRRRNREEVLRSIMPEDIQAAAKKFLSEEPVEIRVIPQPTAAE